ncbi:MAG TPA: hypothetical protein VFE60_20005, partial [Roseiarcus sp.]|nr:hypothetical protein [Roseiarcus sp.]
SIIGLSMAVLPCCAEEDVEAGSAALRVDWPVYPRRAEHNTVAEGGNRGWPETVASGPPAKIGSKERPERHALRTWRAAIPGFLQSMSADTARLW